MTRYKINSIERETATGYLYVDVEFYNDASLSVIHRNSFSIDAAGHDHIAVRAAIERYINRHPGFVDVPEDYRAHRTVRAPVVDLPPQAQAVINAIFIAGQLVRS